MGFCKMIRLKELLNEELVGTYIGHEMYKNPKSIKRMVAELRGISFPNGDLFVIDDATHTTHSSLSFGLNATGISIKDNGTMTAIVNLVKKGYIMWQRKGKTNDFLLSESLNKAITSKYEIMPYIKKNIKKVQQKNSQYNFKLTSIWDEKW